jgi:hypothetical protein
MQENIQKEWQCRWSPTLGNLEDTHQNTWGTKEYKYLEKPTVFMGVYSYRDFLDIWSHANRSLDKPCILWCGGDILRLTKTGYWLHDTDIMRLDSHILAKWINANCDNYVENQVEYDALRGFGIESKIVPSFLGNVNDYDISFKPGNKVYASVSGDNFEQYGWYKIENMAKENPDIEFHLYGNQSGWNTKNKNVIVHGRVDKSIMNAEIKEMQGGLRLLEFDGFSEILAKSVLWGQYPISEIEYPHMLKPGQIREILDKKTPNFKGRNHYLEVLNKYPWNKYASIS